MRLLSLKLVCVGFLGRILLLQGSLALPFQEPFSRPGFVEAVSIFLTILSNVCQRLPHQMESANLMWGARHLDRLKGHQQDLMVQVCYSLFVLQSFVLTLGLICFEQSFFHPQLIS